MPSQDGIWIINAAAETVLANDRMADILGTTSADMVGQPSFEYVFEEDREAAQQLFQIRSKGGYEPFHFRLRRKDGSAVWVDVQGTPMFNAAGEFNGIVGTFTLSSRTGW